MLDGRLSSYINCLYLQIHFSPLMNNIENSLSLDTVACTIRNANKTVLRQRTIHQNTNYNFGISIGWREKKCYDQLVPRAFVFKWELSHNSCIGQVPSHEYLIKFIVCHDLSTAIFFSYLEQKIFMFVGDIIPSPAGHPNIRLLADICLPLNHRFNTPRICTDANCKHNVSSL